MANIKVGDKVQIINGVLSGAVCVVGDIVRGGGISGSDLFLLCSSRPSVSAWYEDDEFKKVGEE